MKISYSDAIDLRCASSTINKIHANEFEIKINELSMNLTVAASKEALGRHAYSFS